MTEENMQALAISISNLHDLVLRMQENMDRRFNEQKADLGKLETKLDDRIAKLETKVDDRIAKLETKLDDSITKLDYRIMKLETKLGDQMNKLEFKLDKNTDRIDEIYFNRDRVKISFSRTFVFGTAIFSALVAFFVALFTPQN